MIITLISILAIMYASVRIDEKFNVPVPLSLIGIATLIHLFFPQLLSVVTNEKEFAEIVLFLLPILLLTDTLEINVSDLMKNGFSLFWLACVSVILSIFSGILLSHTVFAEYDLSVAAVILLFSMVLATDPVSVVSVFSKFELPHKLKILAEGESLFNDATALIAFVFIGLYMLEGNPISTFYVAKISIVVVCGTVITGLVIGALGILLIKATSNQTAEMIGIVIAAYVSFYVAEHFYLILSLFGSHSHLHLSGILSLIVTALVINMFFASTEKAEEKAEESSDDEKKVVESSNPFVVKAILSKLRLTKETRERHQLSKKNIQMFALMANTVLFIAMGEIINFDLLTKYWHEIVIMFITTTVIRAIMMAKFAVLSNTITKQNHISWRWWSVLTFAGIKGGLSIVMLTMIPKDFEYFEMFQAVVIGTIILSTLVYTIGLMSVIAKNKAIFKLEKIQEKKENK